MRLYSLFRAVEGAKFFPCQNFVKGASFPRIPLNLSCLGRG